MPNMTSIWKLALLILQIVWMPLLHAAEPAPSGQEHLVHVDDYKEKAKEIDALIKDHKQLKQDYKEKFFINPELTPLEKLQKIEAHCDSVIEAAESEKAALLAIASFHQNSADEF
jgi:hypothetical protein